MAEDSWRHEGSRKMSSDQLTLLEATRNVLRTAGKALTIPQIWNEIQAQGLFSSEGKTPERTLSTEVRRATVGVEITHARAQKFFYLAGPATFGLIEWLDDEVEAESEEQNAVSGSSVARRDANAISLRAIRSILDSARDFDFSLMGKAITVGTEVLPSEGWPREMQGLDEELDGPWPGEVRVHVRWEAGNTELRVKAKSWKNSKLHGDSCGLSVVENSQELLWITVPASLKREPDGAIVRVPATVTLFRNREPLGAGSSAGSRALVEIVRNLGIPFKTKLNAEAFSVALPSGKVGPSPSDAFERLVKIALAKLPFMSDVSPIYDALAAAQEVEEPGLRGKSAGVQPLPGGVRAYKEALDKVLDWIGNQVKQPEELEAFFQDEFDATGKSVLAYIQMLRGLGVVRLDAGVFSITDAGREYAQRKASDALFELLHRRYTGMLETLVVVRSTDGSTSEISRLLQLVLGVEWQSANQINLRRNWLLSLGLLERDDEGDSVSAAGEAILASHSEEVVEIQAELEKLATEEELDQGDDATSPEPIAGEPPGWSGERVELLPEDVTPHLGTLVFPEGLVAQACAALSAGKHLLLVGPPGTGKTEFAQVLSAAAKSEGYCAGMFSSTASADWTTYETMGGYVLRKDGSLSFRSGVFLSALKQWKWLLIDELNRADIDKAFGELMTVLSGKSADTPFIDDEGKPVSIGPEETRTHVMPGAFRVIATMNIWDKTSLFRLSYAVQRRFAIIHVGPPAPDVYSKLLRREAEKDWIEPPLEAVVAVRIAELFSLKGVLLLRDVGPAIALDMIRYMRTRKAGYKGMAEAIAMYLLPQLEGVEPSVAEKLWALLLVALGGDTGAEIYLKERFLELFPLASVS